MDAKLVDDFCNPDKTEADKEKLLETIKKKIQNENITLNQVVHSLGNYITNTDERIRSQAYRLLNASLKTFTTIPAQSVASLAKFFAERLHDFECLPDLLPCIVTILQKFSVHVDQVVFLMTQLFSEVHVRSLSAPTRRMVYDILEWILQNHPKICMDEYVSGFISAIDGERDPVNLMKVFDLFPKVAQVSHKNVENHAEEMFDVVFCYFPISFTADPNDPNQITPEKLSEKLRICLGAHPAFTTYGITGLLDKLTSTIPETKVESLVTLEYCIPRYGRIALTPHVSDIWASLKTEALRSKDDSVLDACMKATAAFAQVLCQEDKEISNENRIASMGGLLNAALREVSSPEVKFADIYGKMINAAASSSQDACELVVSQMVPSLQEVFAVADTKPKKSGVLLLFTKLLEALSKYPTVKSVSLVSKIWEIAKSCLKDSTIKKEVIDLLTRIALFPEQADTDTIFEFLRSALLSDGITSNRVLSGIEWIAERKPELIKIHILSHIFETINKNDLKQFDTISHIVSHIGTKCTNLSADVFDMLSQSIHSLFNKVENKIREGLLTIANDVLAKATITTQKAIQYVYAFTTLTIDQCLNDKLIEDKNLELLSAICHRIHRTLDATSQLKVMQDLLSAVLDSKVDKFTSIQSKFQPLQVSSPTSQVQFVSLFSAILVACRREITIPNAKDLCNRLLQISMSPKVLKSEGASHAIASIINKINDEKEFEAIMASISESCINTLSSESSTPNKLQALTTLSWVTKAVTMRGQYSWSDKLAKVICELLGDSDRKIANQAAAAIQIIMADHPTILHSQTHAITKVLYKQRFFSVHLGKLLEILKNTKGDEGPIMLAVSHLVDNVPTSVIINQASKLFPLVYRALSSKETQMILASLKTLHTLLQHAQSYMQDQLNAFLPRVLELTRLQESMAVRIVALGCIELLLAYPTVKIYPFKSTILRGLEPALDDKKRNVRKVAVRCVNYW